MLLGNIMKLMKIENFALLLMLALVSVPEFGNCQNIGLKKMADIYAEPGSSVCVSNGEVIIFDWYKSEGVVRTFQVGTIDTIWIQNQKKLKISEFTSMLQSKRKESFCIDSVGYKEYEYIKNFKEDLPVPENNVVLKYNSCQNFEIYLTQDTLKWQFNLVVLKGGKLNHELIGVMSNGELGADFFIYDISGGGVPEIFVVKHVLIGSNEGVYLQVYNQSLL